ncbi:MAG TPA: hypothetical protein VFI69_07035 [Candidatus Limnocylindrales bacterium]|nr:hypothetical protein [Candidatus Limnocylindrales bacterium]
MIVVIGSLRLRAIDDGFAPDGLAADIARVAAADGSRVEFIGKLGDDPAGDELLLALSRSHVGHVATLRDATHATPVLGAAASESDPAAETDDREPETEPAGPTTDEQPAAAAEGPTAGPTAAKPAAAEPAAAEPAANAQITDVPTLEPADVGLALRYLSDVDVIVAAHVAPAVVQEAIDAAAWASAPLIVVIEHDTDLPPSLPPGALVVMAAGDDGDSGLGEAIGRYAAALDRGDDRAEAYAAFAAAGSSA